MGKSSIDNLKLTIQPVGNNALICYLPEQVQVEYPLILQILSTRVKSEDIIDFVVSYHSLLVIFDPDKNNAKDLAVLLESHLPEATRLSHESSQQRLIRLPICYETPYSLDLQSVAERAKLTCDEVIELHTETTYTVCCSGFIPGFAFLGYVDDDIATPRHDEPRAKTPAGSVGIAGNQTGVYPADSPGGWQIIGRTPMKLYSPEKNLFSRFETGDKVQFYPITADDFSAWSDDD